MSFDAFSSAFINFPGHWKCTRRCIPPPHTGLVLLPGSQTFHIVQRTIYIQQYRARRFLRTEKRLQQIKTPPKTNPNRSAKTNRLSPLLRPILADFDMKPRFSLNRGQNTRALYSRRSKLSLTYLRCWGAKFKNSWRLPAMIKQQHSRSLLRLEDGRRSRAGLHWDTWQEARHTYSCISPQRLKMAGAINRSADMTGGALGERKISCCHMLRRCEHIQTRLF